MWKAKAISETTVKLYGRSYFSSFLAGTCETLKQGPFSHCSSIFLWQFQGGIWLAIKYCRSISLQRDQMSSWFYLNSNRARLKSLTPDDVGLQAKCHYSSIDFFYASHLAANCILIAVLTAHKQADLHFPVEIYKSSLVFIVPRLFQQGINRASLLFFAFCCFGCLFCKNVCHKRFPHPLVHSIVVVKVQS